LRGFSSLQGWPSIAPRYNVTNHSVKLKSSFDQEDVLAPLRLPATFRDVAAFLGLLLGAYLFVEIAIFHSGLYARFLEPDFSATGYLERVLSSEVHRKATGKREILVVGNSRIAEGFSAKIANQNASRDGDWF